MKKVLSIFCCFSFLLLFLFMVQTEAHAQNQKLYNVGTSNLNVRTAPSHDASVVGHLDKGQQVNGFKEKNGWVQTYYDGDIAWVASQYLTETDEGSLDKQMEDTKKVDKVKITATDVNVRSGPGKNNKVIDRTTNGDTFNLIESKDHWVKVKMDSGEGWIFSDLTNQSSGEKVKNSSSGTLDGINIILDPGHGGKDPGSIGLNDVQEKDLINTTTDKVAEQLEQKGATVIKTRPENKYSSLDERIRISNAYNTDAFISLHYDVFPNANIKGTSTYYYDGGADKQLAQNIQQSLVNVNGVSDRGVKHGNYKVLRDNNDLGVLIEMGFITNQAELELAQTADFQNNTAEAIVDGLVTYFNK